MAYAEDMCDIVVDHAGDRVRFFVRADPETREQDVLHVREDLAWTDQRAETVDRELGEVIAKDVYAEQMRAAEVTQIIKVADSSVLFTGFIEEEVVVVHFERGILGSLPAMVAEFREYMVEHGIDFTALSVTPDS